MPKDYNAKLDAVLKEIKVKNDKEGFAVRLMSYNGNTPRLVVEKYYKDKTGEWRKDSKAKVRIPFRLLRYLHTNFGTLDGAFAEWEKSHQEPSRQRDVDEESF